MGLRWRSLGTTAAHGEAMVIRTTVAMATACLYYGGYWPGYGGTWPYHGGWGYAPYAAVPAKSGTAKKSKSSEAAK